MDAIYLDIRKGFDSVPHNVLLCLTVNVLQCPWSLGICGNLWSWFGAYLHNRQQCVRISDSISEVLPVLPGVPQGSILGPLLSIFYINDLPSLFKDLPSCLFADDTKCIHAAKTTDNFNKIQEDLNIAGNWSVSNNLLFNCPKSAVLHFWSNSSILIFLNNNIIDSRESIKDFGITISWSTHCNMVVSRAYKQLGLICRSFTTNCTLV